MNFLKNIWYSFPIRLLILHFKSYQFLVIPWILIAVTVLQHFGNTYGIPYLFLDPEFLGIVGYFSFQLVGICFGVFFITWNMATYLLHSYKFPFVASLKWPFAMFTLNNSILPLSFIIMYIWQLVRFQNVETLKEPMQIFWSVLGLVAGIALVLLITAVYFVVTNKDVFGYINNEKQDFKHDGETWLDLEGNKQAMRVDFYLTRKFRMRAVRDVTHYDDAILKRVFLQHHANAFLLLVLNAALIIGLGFIIDKPFFDIPASGSIFLFFSLLSGVAGFVYYWAGSWGGVVLIVMLFVLNFFSQFDAFNYSNQAYGLDYDAPPVEYSLSHLNEIASKENIEADTEATEAVLNKWKDKNCLGKGSKFKPRMLIVISSGGGATAACFTMKVLQTADSITDQSFMRRTALMTGASGGIMGVGYFRELYLQNQLGLLDDLYNPQYQKDVSKDLLNKIMSSVVTNDFFYPFQSRVINDYKYVVDRGMMMEHAFNLHTHGVLDKPLSSYETFERNATIPMLFVGGTNLSDNRKMVISPLKVSYMMKASSSHSDLQDYEIDAIDFGRFFENNNAPNLRFLSALRINATYPLLMPSVSMPSSPQIDLVDMGVRDNYGMENAIRFINTFHDWINVNTSGVVLVQIRGVGKHNEVKDFEYKSFINRTTGFFGSMYSNITVTQDYLHDYMLDGTNDLLDKQIEVIRFQYMPDDEKARASMSFRLTEREIENVLQTAVNETNMEGYYRLNEILD